MKLSNLSLTELAAYVSSHLERCGIQIAVVGGSAITAWAPDVYTSDDIDFAAPANQTRKEIASALAQIGFFPKGRIFVHADCRYTLDFVATTPHIDRRPVTRFEVVQTAYGSVRVYAPEDAIADRIAAWVHWSDSESLGVAEEATRQLAGRMNVKSVDDRLAQLSPGDQSAQLRLFRARERIRAILAAITTAPRPRTGK